MQRLPSGGIKPYWKKDPIAQDNYRCKKYSFLAKGKQETICYPRRITESPFLGTFLMGLAPVLECWDTGLFFPKNWKLLSVHTIVLVAEGGSCHEPVLLGLRVEQRPGSRGTPWGAPFPAQRLLPMPSPTPRSSLSGPRRTWPPRSLRHGPWTPSPHSRWVLAWSVCAASGTSVPHRRTANLPQTKNDNEKNC